MDSLVVLYICRHSCVDKSDESAKLPPEFLDFANGGDRVALPLLKYCMEPDNCRRTLGDPADWDRR